MYFTQGKRPKVGFPGFLAALRSAKDAGAVFGPPAFARARSIDLRPGDFLGRSDSAGFFDTLGALLDTGPTLTNVNDLRLIHLQASPG